jgi:hypothetical protein
VVGCLKSDKPTTKQNVLFAVCEKCDEKEKKRRKKGYINFLIYENMVKTEFILFRWYKVHCE